MSEIIYKIEIKTTDKLCAGKISKTIRFSIRKGSYQSMNLISFDFLYQKKELTMMYTCKLSAKKTRLTFRK